MGTDGIRNGLGPQRCGLGFAPMGEETLQATSGVGAERAGNPPRSYLAWSIIATAVLFLPLGLVALFFSLRTRALLRRGDLDEAQRASRVTLVVVVVTTVVGVIAYVALVGALLALGAFGGG